MSASAQNLAPASVGGGKITPRFLALFTALVFVTTWACAALVHHTGRISPIWISNAIVLAVLLRRPTRHWGELAAIATLTAMAADVVVGDNPVNTVGFSLANIAEVLLIGATLRWLHFDRSFSRIESLLTFYGLVVAGSAVASALGAGTLYLTEGVAFLPSVVSWFGADALGLSLLVPFFMCVRPADFQAMFGPGQRIGTLVLLGMVPVVGVVCYAFPRLTPSFLFIPVLIMLTFRRGFAGGALGLFIAMSISFYLAASHHVSISLLQLSAAERVGLVQLYYAVIGFTIILAGASLDDRRRLESSLLLAAQRAEAAREEAYLAKEVTEKASNAKSAFLANMSHELRTPLNAVLGFSEIISSEMYGPCGDLRYRDYAGLINRAGKHLLDLIGDILDMSKIEAGKLELQLERLDVAVLARDCAELMAERAAAGDVALDLADAQTAVLLTVDRRAVKQILLNLLSNAIKFTPEGGRIALSVSDEGAMCRIAVADTGVGIPDGELGRLGNPFVQLSNNSGKHSGTGLGLALVRGLSELHGGWMRIESCEGQGTTATVALPMRSPVVVSQAA
ncbi:MAG TPA: ATP-binding protein [Rhizomicrobium sp.]